MLNYKLPEIIVRNMNQLSGTVNTFQESKTYIEIVSTVHMNSVKCFCAVRYGKSVNETFFKNQNIAHKRP